MPRVSPFPGLLFDPDRVGPLERVTTPPYDVIGPEDRQRYLRASPHNVVRLVLGEDEPEDSHAGDRYRRASETLERWRSEGVLTPWPRPAYFPYEMRFALGGTRRRIRGLICALVLENWGGSIVPHEETLAQTVEDRLHHLQALFANLDPVYAVHRQPCPSLSRLLGEVAESEPARTLTDEEGVEHRLWILEETIDVSPWLEDVTLLVADGHHRFTTALLFRDEMRGHHGSGPWDLLMTLVVDASAEHPPVLPYHRLLVRWPIPQAGRRVRDLAEILAEVSDDDLLYGIASREDGGMVHRVAELSGAPPAVAALHREVLPPIPPEGTIRYTPDPVIAEDLVRRGAVPGALFLPGTSAERIWSVIERGERLPQKSTYFWPKPRTGMVIRPLE